MSAPVDAVAATPSPPPPAGHRRARGLRRAGLWLALLALALVFTVAGLVGTAAGTRWLFAHLLAVSGEPVEIVGLEGSLISELRAESVKVREVPGLSLHALRLIWEPTALLHGELRLASVEVGSLRLPPAAAPPVAPPVAEPTLRLPRLPLIVVIERLALGPVLAADGRLIDNLELAARLDDAGLRVTGLALRAGPDRLEGELALRPAAGLPQLSSRLTWRGPHRLPPDLEGATPAAPDGEALLEASGPLDDLELRIISRRPFAARIEGRVQGLPGPPVLALAGAIDDPGPLTGLVPLAVTAWPDLRLDGSVAEGFRLSAGFTAGPADGRHPYAVTLMLHSSAGAPPADALRELRLDWQAEAVFAAAFETSAPEAVEPSAWPRRLAGHGRIEATDAGLDLELVGEGELSPLGPVEIDLAATLAPARVGITRLTLSALSGRLDAEGQVGLPTGTAPAAIALAFSAADLDLEPLLPGVPSRLAATGRIELDLAPAGPQGELRLERLAGRWRGAPLEARGRIRLEPGRQTVEDLHATLGRNRLEGQVTLAPERLGGTVALDLPELARLHPALTGSLTGRLELGGTPVAPAARGQLRGRELRFQDRGAGRIDATVALDPAGDSRINLTAAAVTAGPGVPIEGLSLVASGRAAAHRIALEASGPGVGLDLDLEGQWQAPRWRGLLHRLEFDHPEAGRWRSRAASAWSWDGGEVAQGDALCLESGDASLCLRDGRLDTRGGGGVAARLEAFDLARLHAGLPEGVPRVLGRLGAAADLRLRPSALPDITFDLAGDGLRVPLTADPPAAGRGTGTDRAAFLRLARLGARGALQDGRLRLDAEAAGDHGLEFELAGFSLPLTEGGGLGGRLSLVLGDLAPLLDWLPVGTASELSGRLRATATLTGSAAAPRLDARFGLADGGLTLPALGQRFTVLDGTLSSLTPGVVDLQAQLGSTAATLALSGRANLRERPPTWWLELDGQDFPLVRRPGLALDVSPELRLGGRGDETLDLTGTITVPTLRLTPFLPGATAVAPSNDVVYVDAVPDAAEPVGPAPLPPLLQRTRMDLTLELGEAVHVTGWGLDTRLAGDLRVQKAQGPAAPRGQGELELIDGRFEAYGQQLAVEQGRILFAGPVDDPRLALRAIRPGIPVRAGVEVTGPLRSPELRLFSEPAQSDADTLAYLVTGRPLAAATARDADALRTAALRMGVGGAALVTAPLARALGLDTLDVATGATVDDTRIQLGKTLSPRLSLRSGYNPFDQLWTFIVNYRLSERWALEAQTGAANSAADIIYRVETDDPREIRNLWR